MAGSMSVFKLTSFEKTKLLRDENHTELQNTLASARLLEGAGPIDTILILEEYNEKEEKAHYSITHYSNIINHPIRAFIDIEKRFSNFIEGEIKKDAPKIQEINSGYQEIYLFRVLLDFKNKECFVFTKKSIASSFMERAKKAGFFNYEDIKFDLAKIKEIPEVSNVWGAWENSIGKCKRKAYFGTAINELDEVDKSQITSYNINYEHENATVDLCITNDARISSNSTIIQEFQLRQIYSSVKDTLIIDSNNSSNE